MISEDIINTFNEIVSEFLTQINNLSINRINMRCSLYLGIQTLTRVLEYSIFQTKSLEKSFIYVKTAETYFLEYLEQINNSEYMENLNLNEIVLFVYKKTIFNLRNTQNDENILTNMMTLADTYVVFDDSELNKVFDDIRSYVNIFFYWENDDLTNNQLAEIHQKYFLQIMKLENKEDIFTVLQHLLQVCSYSYNEYKLLIKDIVDLSKKKKMKKMTSELYLQVFYVEKENLIENRRKMTSKNFIKWLLG